MNILICTNLYFVKINPCITTNIISLISIHFSFPLLLLENSYPNPLYNLLISKKTIEFQNHANNGSHVQNHKMHCCLYWKHKFNRKIIYVNTCLGSDPVSINLQMEILEKGKFIWDVWHQANDHLNWHNKKTKMK